MNRRASRSVVVLGMMSKMPVPGVIWQTVHYLVGLRRLGYHVTYVEAHARTPSMFVEGTRDAGSRRTAAFLRRVLGHFDAADRWAFHALHHDGAYLGMDRDALHAAYRSADVILNLCGGTRPLPEHTATGRLVLVVTDPVQIEVELSHGNAGTRELLDAHCAVFTFGENLGRPGCQVPMVSGYAPMPTRQPVVLAFWDHDAPDRGAYTTVANWHQPFRPVRHQGEVYHWSKDLEFRNFLDLPRRAPRPLELALASFQAEDRSLLERHGWRVREAAAFGFDAHAYRDYIQRSRGEFTVAKDQNVRLRSGWFSDRSATYLASGRPVVTQDTGFDAVLPTGRGLFGVLHVDGAAEALARIEADYAAASRAARDVARACFDHRVVLTRLLADVGLEGPRRPFAPGRPGPVADGAADGEGGAVVPDGLVLEPLSRRPLRVPPESVRTLLQRPVPALPGPAPSEPPAHAASASVIVVTFGNLHLTRLCLETALANTRHPAWELLVVDNASTDDTPAYLRELAARNGAVRLILNPANEGFAAACNHGARAARGDALVFLNNDTVLAPGWLEALTAPLADPGLGAVSAVTGRSGTAADLAGDPPRTYGAFVRRAAEHARAHGGSVRPADMLAFFCLAMRRDTWLRVGELDEEYGTGLFEDDDYSARLTEAGYRLGCADGAFVYHFGEGAFGDLVSDGTYARMFARNRERFEHKWGRRPARSGRGGDEYAEVVRRVVADTAELVGQGATVAVVSRGDDRLLDLGHARGWHFPRQDDGTWSGHYPADGPDALRLLLRTRARGADYLLIPRTGFWWLDHYGALREYLERSCRLVARSPDIILYGLDGLVDGPSSAVRPTRSGHATPPRPVFIIGSPRSGTSILTWALGQHPNLYPLEETAWFGRLHAGALEAFQIGSERGERSHLSAMGITRAEYFAALGDALDGLTRRHREWPAEGIPRTQAFARARSPDQLKDRWVDGTPHNSFHVNGIAELFPHATFIHLLREPHLVARSLQRFHNIGGRRHNPDEAYRTWLAHVRACLEAEEILGPERIVRVLHRDLASSPETVLRTCLDFVGERYVSECLLPLAHRINSSGETPLPADAAGEEASAGIVREVEALAAEVFPTVEAH